MGFAAEVALDFQQHGVSGIRIDELIDFVHVSKQSDDFGFDLLGFLAGTIGGNPEVLFLEVKSSAGRSFQASTHEWDVAERPSTRALYAFLVMPRGEGGRPTAMEILRDPATLLDQGRITRSVNDWRVDYGVSSSDEVPSGHEPPGEGMPVG